MAAVHEIQGFVLVLDKIVHITRVFEASDEQGAQFNVRLMGDTLLKLRFPDRAQATLEREMLVKALKEI
ncbi:MAG: hypothetical protein R3200_07910 [Xanthomonadales bacterium]|nr:hypothetical protein [Xanthomonadales bacterium]